MARLDRAARQAGGGRRPRGAALPPAGLIGSGRQHQDSARRSGSLLANLAGALFVTVLGTGTIALTLKSAWLRHWLYHDQHLAGAASYSHELTASSDAAMYLLICLAFPVIGLALGVFGGMDESGTGQSWPQPGGGGGPGPRPEPGPPGGRRLPDAGAEEALLFLDRADLDGEEAQADLVGAVSGHAGPSSPVGWTR